MGYEYRIGVSLRMAELAERLSGHSDYEIVSCTATRLALRCRACRSQWAEEAEILSADDSLLVLIHAMERPDRLCLLARIQPGEWEEV